MSFKLLAIAAFAAFPCVALAEIEVHDAYAIAATPQAMAAGAFMTIHNHGGAPDRLIAVRSGVSHLTQLHTHIAGADGMMQMVEVKEGWPLPTDAELVLQRGGHHVMFMGLTTPFTDGMVVDLTLVFEVAGEITVQVPVDLSRLGEGAPMDMGTMDHGAMEAPAPAP